MRTCVRSCAVSLFGEESKDVLFKPHFRVYDSRRPPEPDYPSVHPSVADFIAEEETEKNEVEDSDSDLTSRDVLMELEGDQDRLAEVELLHAPPGLVSDHTSPASVS